MSPAVTKSGTEVVDRDAFAYKLSLDGVPCDFERPRHVDSKARSYNKN